MATEQKTRRERVRKFVYHGHTTSSICPSQSWIEEFAVAFAEAEIAIRSSLESSSECTCESEVCICVAAGRVSVESE